MTTRKTAIAAAETYFDSGAFLDDLARLVAIPSESQNPQAAPHLIRYLDAAMIPMLAALGFTCRTHPNPAGGAPFLLAARIEDPALPTVLTYGHGDVIRAQTEQWRDGLMPFAIVEEGERVYGRGTADNKGQHLINLRALTAVLKSRGTFGFNVKVLIEMGEEIGSPGLRAFCEANAQVLAADVLIASDGPRLAPDVPTIFTGSRGGITFDLLAHFREGAHHSGNFGGLIADPSIVLAHARRPSPTRAARCASPNGAPTA